MLNKVKFVADSGIDIKHIEGVNFERASLTISTDEREYLDNDDLDLHEMLDYLRAYKGRSYTACPSVDTWMKAFGTQDIPDEIYVVTLTSGLSGTYNSACLAKNLYCEMYPNTKILIVDSLTVGSEERLIMEKMIDMKQSGMTFEEISEKIEDYRKSTRLFFAFQSIHNLVQNGRVSKIAGLAAGALNISIVGTASEVGTIETIAKSRGDKRVIKEIIKAMEQAGYKGGKVYICHGENEPLCEKIIGAILEKFPDAQATYYLAGGICGYYGERGGIILGCECA